MVIQRWQSLLLLLAVVCMGLFSFLSLGQVQTSDWTFDFTAYGFSVEGEATGAMVPEFVSTWYFFAVSLLSAVIPLIAIFTFKHFRLQKNLCLLSILFAACVVAVGALLGYQTIDGGALNWSSLVCAPFIAIIAESMAYNRICADHKVIRDTYRLRD